MYRMLVTFLTVGVLAIRAAIGGPVDGLAYLQGESNHSGIQVFAKNTIAPSITYTTYSAASGFYEFAWVVSGWYDFEYSHEGCITQTLHNVYVPPVLRKHLPDVTLARADTGCGTGWRDYPYEPPGTDIRFPADEGRHDPIASFPTEWWYANFNLTGSDPAHKYGAFVAFFKTTPGSGMRLFSISDLGQAQIYSARRFGPFSALTAYLDLSFYHVGELEAGEPQGGSNGSGQDIEGSARDNEESGGRIVAAPGHSEGTVVTPTGLITCDRWYNKKSGGDLLPFEYRLEVKDKAIQDLNTIRLDADMYSLKSPMIEGGDGLIEVGDDWSYYYSHTRVNVSGTIQVHERSEPVTGYAWVDHQWGNMCLDCDVSWEWFSIQLNDTSEIMVADVWVDGVHQGVCCSGLNLCRRNCSLELLPNSAIDTLRTWMDDVSQRRFATKWLITEQSKPILLTVTADFQEQAMELGWPQVFPVDFWEGSCSVSGTIAGKQVSGKAYAELTHSWESGGGNPTKSGSGSGDQKVESTVTEYSPPLPTQFFLSQNYPNPFNPTTTIQYGLPEPGQVRIAVYDILGQQVATLVDDFRPAGNYMLTWNASDIPSGAYFVQMRAGVYTHSIKLIVLK